MAPTDTSDVVVVIDCTQNDFIRTPPDRRLLECSSIVWYVIRLTRNRIRKHYTFGKRRKKCSVTVNLLLYDGTRSSTFLVQFQTFVLRNNNTRKFLFTTTKIGEEVGSTLFVFQSRKCARVLVRKRSISLFSRSMCDSYIVHMFGIFFCILYEVSLIMC